MVFCYCEQGFRTHARGRDIPAAAFNNRLIENCAGDSRDMAQLRGPAGRPVDKLSGALELAQMPFRQREEVRRTRSSVIAEPEQRFSVSLTDVVAQCLLEDGSRRLQVAQKEQD